MERRRVYNKKGRRFSRRDHQTVISYLHEKTYEEIGQMIGRDARAVLQHVHCVMKTKKRTCTRPWTPQEEAYLRRYWGTQSCAVIGQELERTANSVYRKARHMKLSLENKFDDTGVMLKTRKRGCAFVWRPSEISYLKIHYPTETYATMCEYLGVSKYTIHKKAVEMGLEKDIEAVNAHKRKNIKHAVLQHVINSHKNKKKNGNIPKPRSDSGISAG